MTDPTAAERETAPDEMTTDELTDKLDEINLRHLYRQPDLAITALEAQGWTLTPPDDSFARPGFAGFMAECRAKAGT